MSKLSLSVEKYAPKRLPQVADPNGVLGMFLWTEVAVDLPEHLTFEAWEEVGRVIGRAGRAVQWWAGDWLRFGERRYGEMYSQGLDATGLDYGTLANYVYVTDRFESSRRRENLSFGHHQEVASEPPEVADAWLDQAEAEGWSIADLRKARRRAKAAEVSVPALPAGKYAVILADPPWQYDFVEADNRAIENQYPTLTADEIACLEDADGRPVADLAADDAVLFLWATNPKLTEALRVIEGWGFRYVTNLVWVKDRIGMGYWARQRHELLLVATRGEMSPPPEGQRPDSVIEFPRGRHSAKPPTVHELIESIWPDTPKVEVFARETRDGWGSFGNQLPEAS